MDENVKVSFALEGIETNHFKVNFETLQEQNNKVGALDVQLGVGTNYQDGLILISLAANFMGDKESILEIEVSTFFLIEPICWSKLSKDLTQDVKLEKEFMVHIIGVAISTARGVLHGILNSLDDYKDLRFLRIPLMMISDLGYPVEEDFIIKRI